MAQIHHFDHGWITPTISYLLSVLGSLLGLTCAVRFRSAQGRGERTWWLLLAAVAIGGTAIWSMHFVAMMGFNVVGTPIRYDVGLTAASAVIAVVAVGVGLVIALPGESARNLRIVTGGVIAGLGVAAMHYTGMAAMRLNGDISYATTRVGLSIAIAVVAAAVALWLTVTVQRPLIIFISALVMGIAVNGMHFTGMSAMTVADQPSANPPDGATASDLLVPIGVAVVFAIVGLGFALMAAPTEEDRAAAAYLAARRNGLAAAEAAATEGATGTALPTAAPTSSGWPSRGAGRNGSAWPTRGSAGNGAAWPAGGTGSNGGFGPGGSGGGFDPRGTAHPQGAGSFPDASGQQGAQGSDESAPGIPRQRPGGQPRGGGLNSSSWTYRDRSSGR